MSPSLRSGVTAALLTASSMSAGSAALAQEAPVIRLPAPATAGGQALTHALARRRSVRAFQDAPLRLADVGQLLWAAQGVTAETPEPAGWRSEWGAWRGGLRTAPSAGALYPLEVYLVAGRVEGLDPGVYHYVPGEHVLQRVGECGPGELAGAASSQRAVADAAAVLVFTAVYQRTEVKYRERAPRYVHIEVGAAAENALLQATALGLGSVFVGAFTDGAVKKVMGLPADHVPLGLVPVGRPGE
ncbi:MAG: SagB/ThcOx family dehydrogenase [Gemmatimonadetes bacterium]|nr:SagB/ThcOx family dehydrogenase [Gemmatimonadota bacterium]